MHVLMEIVWCSYRPHEQNAGYFCNTPLPPGFLQHSRKCTRLLIWSSMHSGVCAPKCLQGLQRATQAPQLPLSSFLLLLQCLQLRTSGLLLLLMMRQLLPFHLQTASRWLSNFLAACLRFSGGCLPIYASPTTYAKCPTPCGG